ncbi:MAG: hypothetical protein HYX53_13555 [Chloroflexi bacterium]|nr:hypothetical protein [Chloroflexota bacterium]
MRLHMTLRRAGLAGIAPLALVGVIGGGVLVARASGDRPATGAATVSDEVSGANSDPTLALAANANLTDDYIAKLAANLGIDEQKLRDALKTTALQELDAAVASGKIPQAMADKIRAAISSGDLGALGLGGLRIGRWEIKPDGAAPNGAPQKPGRFGFGLFPGGKNLDAVAGFLGITTDVLKSELGGKTLAQEAQAHGKTRDELKAFLIAENAKEIDAAVAAGKLTADQAATEKQRFADGIEKMLDATVPNRVKGAVHTP